MRKSDILNFSRLDKFDGLCSKGCIYEVRGKLVFGLLIGLNIWGRIFGWGWDLYTTRHFNGQYIGRFIYQLVLKIVHFS